MELECTLTRMRGKIGIGEAKKATVNGKTVVQAELTFAIGD